MKMRITFHFGFLFIVFDGAMSGKWFYLFIHSACRFVILCILIYNRTIIHSKNNPNIYFRICICISCVFNKSNRVSMEFHLNAMKYCGVFLAFESNEARLATIALIWKLSSLASFLFNFSTRKLHGIYRSFNA